MKILNKVTIRWLEKVLIRQASELRQCPYCGSKFIPVDQVARDAWDMHERLFAKNKVLGMKVFKPLGMGFLVGATIFTGGVALACFAIGMFSAATVVVRWLGLQ